MYFVSQNKLKIIVVLKGMKGSKREHQPAQLGELVSTRLRARTRRKTTGGPEH
jgi:hypothetical protein